MTIPNPQPGSRFQPERSFVIEPARDSEAGYMLVAVVVMVALVLIALSVAAPVIGKSIRRDKEVESEHRAEQYVRAIRVYYRKTHAYPPSMDALKQSSNIRYLRQEYVDPLTGKSDWRIIHLGEQKTTVKGYFGQELGGLGASASSGGLGSAGGMTSGFGGSASSTSTIGSTSALASGFSGASVTTAGSGASGAGASGGGVGAAGSSGASGSTSGGLGSLSGAQSGGVGPIIGVGPAASGTSIAAPNQQTTYEAWEFWYDPRIELMYQKGQQAEGGGTGSLGSQSASSFGTNINGQSNSTTGAGTGTTNGAGSSMGFGSTMGSGTSPTPTPTTPQ